MSTKKSGSCCVEVMIEGVPVTGLIDIGSDIAIIRGDLFYQIISESGLRWRSSSSPMQLIVFINIAETRPFTLLNRRCSVRNSSSW